jgi:hypothetical protein
MAAGHGILSPENSVKQRKEIDMGRSSWQGDISLSALPDWFIKQKDSLELIALWYSENKTEKETKLKEIFDSVFVLAFKYEEEEEGKPDKEVVEFVGCDTMKALSEKLKKEWEKDVPFIYHTRKNVYLEADLQVTIEIASGQNEPVSDTETEKGQGKNETAKYHPLPGLQKGLPPGPGETRPGEVGPRRIS